MTKALTAKRELITVLNEKTTKLPLKYKKWPQTISTSYGSDELQHHNDEEENDDSNDLYNKENPSYQKFLKDLLKKYKEEPSLTPQQFQSEFIDIIPSQWVVCSVTADVENNELYICRFCQKMPPLLLQLPLKQQSDRVEFLYNDAIGEFKEIMDLNDQNLKLAKRISQMTDSQMTDSQRIRWWEERKELDDRMKVLLKKIEDYWLGGFKVSCVYIFIYLSILLFQKKGSPYLIFDLFCH